MDKEKYEKVVQISKEICYNYKHHIGDIFLQLEKANRELGLESGMHSRWESTSVFDLEKFEGIFFILTGERYGKD
jgi:hypothetical protein